MRLQGAKFRRSVSVAAGSGHKREAVEGKWQRDEPSGDFSRFLPPDDPIRLELESMFPPNI
jgi:hypothetical protein